MQVPSDIERLLPQSERYLGLRAEPGSWADQQWFPSFGALEEDWAFQRLWPLSQGETDDWSGEAPTSNVIEGGKKDTKDQCVTDIKEQKQDDGQLLL
jgi:hypothetical protein